MARRKRAKRTVPALVQCPFNAELGTLAVDDPYEPGGTVVAVRSLRDDPLAALHNGRRIDDAQFRAGRHWQEAYERSATSTIRSLDLARERVDGGRMPDLAAGETQMRALATLAQASAALGLEGEAIVRDVLGERMTVALAAARRGLTSEPERKYIGRRFRECLDTLAVLFGYAMPRRPPC